MATADPSARPSASSMPIRHRRRQRWRSSDLIPTADLAFPAGTARAHPRSGITTRRYRDTNAETASINARRADYSAASLYLGIRS